MKQVKEMMITQEACNLTRIWLYQDFFIFFFIFPSGKPSHNQIIIPQIYFTFIRQSIRSYFTAQEFLKNGFTYWILAQCNFSEILQAIFGFDIMKLLSKNVILICENRFVFELYKQYPIWDLRGPFKYWCANKDTHDSVYIYL